MEMTVSTPNKIGSYQIRGTIGTGAFSVVKLAYDEARKRYMACKIVPKSRLSSPELEQRFEIEIKIFQQLTHPGIITLYDLLKDDLNYYIFMEFCPNGELFQHIVDEGKLSEDETKTIVYQVFSVLSYIHSKGIAHRDLKPENLLLDEQGHVKISDFGLSRFVGQTGIANTPCGSPCYASPECVSGCPYNAFTSDVWSTGVIIYAMLTGQLPWTKRNQTQLFQQIRRGEYTIPKHLTPDCQNFIQGLMTVDITKRLTIEEALNHPWMAAVTKSFREQGLFEATEHTCPLVSTKKVEALFCEDAAEPLAIDQRTLFRNLSFSDKLFGKTVKMLKVNNSNLPQLQQKTSKHKHGTPPPSKVLATKTIPKRMSQITKPTTITVTSMSKLPQSKSGMPKLKK
ncbi:CAMK family protein kinase [Trichomonas vaginalis G3]|uniref:CAMK family protein kinase n=1 Tax=Trichomonas vaginalis (strain ATCC PRA-98 / G3) TaxID=412133 RepID=A2FMX7_TRIV3|nr:protein serine/threonine kinase protein [Trichomonas vaginalis G3]EAX93745.1 CAMK family protein kinase [Trichomonas vaginalis G3]KAI5533760.1 protein serine/threonine kinase protein [Trichomonas vaginalis G3]|eukprot:XP_001306675.1 CAMK family protein kinase [Trichomonas vaginalis G3]